MEGCSSEIYYGLVIREKAETPREVRQNSHGHLSYLNECRVILSRPLCAIWCIAQGVDAAIACHIIAVDHIRRPGGSHISCSIRANVELIPRLAISFIEADILQPYLGIWCQLHCASDAPIDDVLVQSKAFEAGGHANHEHWVLAFAAAHRAICMRCVALMIVAEDSNTTSR